MPQNEKVNIVEYIMGEGEKRKLPPGLAKLVKTIAIVTTLYNLWSVIGFPTPILHRGITFSLFFALTFMIYTAPGSKSKNYIPWYDWVFVGLSMTVGIYIVANLNRLVTRFPFSDVVTGFDILMGIITMILLLEGTRRIIGPWLSILSILSLLYALYGNVIPGLFGHNGFSISSIIDELFLTTDGIWGQALGIASTYIILFIIFGAFLQTSGAGDFLFEFASALAGWSRGGLAKVGIIASGLFGMISGSPVANVSSVGTITIPMMKKSGYPADFAAAVECCASTGGTIMPPVMGSVAFLMAEVIGVPYISVAAAAAIPAVIYYLAIFFAIDFRAAKLGMKGLSRDEIPPLAKTLIKGLGFFIPLVYLVVRLMEGLSPSRVALETTIIILIISWLRPETRMGWTKILKALEDGTRSGILVISTCATSGIMIGIINLTGVGTKFSSYLMALSGNAEIFTLIFTMLLALILGLAMNITPSYLLAAVVAGPVLINLGIPPMAAHMFILFFAAVATMTPPVATAAFAAAGIADAEPMRVGFLACRIGLVAFIMPYIFIYQNALLLIGLPVQIFIAAISGIFGVALIAAAFEGWFGRNLNVLQRIILAVSGFMSITGMLYLTIVAVILAVLSISLGKVVNSITIKNND